MDYGKPMVEVMKAYTYILRCSDNSLYTGWTTDLKGTFNRIASYLKKDGIFIFSWGHPLHYCVAKSYETGEDVVDNGELVFSRSYFDESYFKMPVHDTDVTFANRKISTYVNALYDAGLGEVTYGN